MENKIAFADEVIAHLFATLSIKFRENDIQSNGKTTMCFHNDRTFVQMSIYTQSVFSLNLIHKV